MAAVRYVVRARADPQILGRLINHFAQLGDIPRRVKAQTEGEFMNVLIDQDGVDDRQAVIVAEKMRASVLVESVRLTRRGRLLVLSSECRS